MMAGRGRCSPAAEGRSGDGVRGRCARDGGRDPRLDRPARGRAHGPRQAVRGPGQPVHGRLRPDPVVAHPRRDRVRAQGDPARRLRAPRRHVPAGARGRRPAGARVGRPPGPGRPRVQRPGDPPGGGPPRLLPPVHPEEARRHARRAGDEPRHRRRAAHRRARRASGSPGATTTVGSVSDCVVAADEGDRDCLPTDPVGSGGRRGHPSRGHHPRVRRGPGGRVGRAAGRHPRDRRRARPHRGRARRPAASSSPSPR